jgi:hypothetical protein
MHANCFVCIEIVCFLNSDEIVIIYEEKNYKQFKY